MVGVVRSRIVEEGVADYNQKCRAVVFIVLDLYFPDNGASCNDVFSRLRSRTRY